MDPELYDQLLAHARRVCAGRSHVLEAEDLLHQVLLVATEQGWLDSPGRLFSHVSWGIRQAIARRATALHLGRVPGTLDGDLTGEGFSVAMVTPAKDNVEREVENRLLLVWATEQMASFPGIWARVAEELGYTDPEVAASLGIDERILRRLRRATVIKGERVIEVCVSCRRQAPLDPEYGLCASCRVPDRWEQLPLPPAPLVRPIYPRAVKVRKSRAKYDPTRWSRHHDACVSCGKADSKHAGKGICNRCYTAAKYAAGERMVNEDGTRHHRKHA